MDSTQSPGIYYYIPTTQTRITTNSNGENILLPAATLGTVVTVNETQSLPSIIPTQADNEGNDTVEVGSAPDTANEPTSLAITLPSEFAFRANEISIAKSTLGETFRVYDLPTQDYNCSLFGIYGRRVTREEVVQQLLASTNDRVQELMAVDMLSLIGAGEELPRQIRQNNRLRSLFERLKEQYYHGIGEDAAREAVLVQLQDRGIFEDYVREFVGGRISESLRSPYYMLTYESGTETEPGTTGALAAIAELNGISLEIYQEIRQADQSTLLVRRLFSYRNNKQHAPLISLLHMSQDIINPNNLNHFQLLIPVQDEQRDNNNITPTVIKDKLEDLDKLKKILTLIDNFISLTSFSKDAVEVLSEIGFLARNLHYNDKRKGNKEYIRNKYGSIDRSRDSAKRNGGLELIHLAAMEKIADKADQEVANVALAELKEDLMIIRQKINLIIDVEKDKPTKKVDEVLDLFRRLGATSRFISFINYFYSKEVLTELLEIINYSELQTLNFAEREDRYYFGRILSLVGELSKDLKDFLNPGKESGLFSFFKKIRDKKMAHTYSAMVADVNEDQSHNLGLLRRLLIQNFNAILNNIKNYLGQFTLTHVSDNPQSIWDDIKKLKVVLNKLTETEKQELNKLLKVIFDEGKDEINEQILSEIGMRTLSIDSEEENSREQEIIKQKAVIVRNASTALEAIVIKVKKILELQDSKKKKAQKDKLAKTITAETLKLIIGYNEAVKNFEELKIVDSEEIPSLASLSNIKAKLEDSEAAIAVVEKQTNEKTLKVKQEGDQNKKAVENKSEVKVQESKQVEQARLKKQLEAKLGIVSKELAYIMHVINNVQGISEQKKNYIVEFSFSKIGQIFKDIEEKEIKEKELLQELVTEEFNKSTQLTESTRHKLMHDILARKKMLDFPKTLFRHTLPLIPEVEALRKIMQDQTLEEAVDSPTDISILFKVGRAYTVLKRYDRATECFENILKMCGAKTTLIGDSISIEEGLEIWGGIINAHFAFSEAYGKAGNDKFHEGIKEEAYEFYQYKIVHLERYVKLLLSIYPDQVSDQLASAYNNLANTYSDIGEYEEAIKNHKKAIIFVRQKSDVKREALYLANLGMTYKHELEKKQANSELIRGMQLVASCLWEAKEGYEKAGVTEDHEYIRVLSSLVHALVYSGKAPHFFYAQELFSRLKSIIERFPCRETEQEILFVRQLEKEIKIAEEIHRLPEIYSPELAEKFKAQRDLIDLEFEIKRLDYLRVFYMEIGLPQDISLNERLIQLQKRLAAYQSNQISIELKFHSEVETLINSASILFRENNFQEALKKYCNALEKLKAEYKNFIPEVIGDLLESIGDTHNALNHFKDALECFTASLEAHAEHGPNDRAFFIPYKILRLNQQLYTNHVELGQKGQKMAEETLENFKKKVGNNDPRLIPIKKNLIAIYFATGDYNKVRNMAKDVGEENLSADDKILLAQIPTTTSSTSQIPSDSSQTLSASVTPPKFKLIEERIFQKCNKLSKECENAYIEIDIRGIEKADFEFYCTSQLNIDSSDLEYDNMKCGISLDKKNIVALRSKFQKNKNL